MIISQPIKDSSSLEEACQLFLSEIGDWVNTCIEDLGNQPANDVHDQGTFTVGWAPYITAAKDMHALEFMKKLRDKIKVHFENSNQWKHGYWNMHEAHHGTEHFQLFLGTLWRLDPGDQETIAQMIDAAEHMGNWVDGIPNWFDWDRGLFRSMFFGSEGVLLEGGRSVNIPDHFRCINICVLAWEMIRDTRYLDLSNAYVNSWADAILESQEIPIGIDENGPIYSLDEKVEKLYRSFVGQLPPSLSPVDRTENILASAGIDAMLNLWQITGIDKYVKAAEKLLDVIVTQIDDPDAGAGVDMLRRYRDITSNERYTEYVLRMDDQLDPYSFSTLSMDPDYRRDSKPSGIGKRQDMAAWYEDGDIRKHNPVLLALISELKGDQRLATRAIDVARSYFSLARKASYPHGHSHGCSARTVNAIVRGHGRDNGSGVVTAVLQPILSRFDFL